MELPSMVQKSGGTLIVRSVVSGIPIYTEDTLEDDKNSNKVPMRVHVGDNSNAFIFGDNFEELKRAQEHLMQQQQQSLVQEHQRLQAAAMELKEEGLPQCKIKRNYSCNYCTYFTQNPRYHLTHLRDVHGEKIVINKCKLCLYASRHYQKLVRHMKMVHGCTDGIASSHGQARGKRGMNREARKRKLEESVPTTGVISAMSVEAINAEHAKNDLEREHQKLQREIESFKKQQEEQQKSHQQKLSEAIFAAAAFEQQLRVQREFDNRESRNAAAHSIYEQQSSSPVQKSESSPSQNKTYDNATPAHQQNSPPIQLTDQRSSLELTPSPSGSNISAPPNGQQQSDALNGGSDEPSNNRLMKCSLCDFTTLYRNLLLEHELEDHCNAKFYRCEKCSYVTHIKARFSKHVKYHSMPMIKCVTCDFRTPYKWNLDRHMKNHGGAGPFKCAACDFTADIKQSLTVHEMNHHVPPVGHAAGMTLVRRRNKVGGTDLNEDFFSDSAEMLEDHFNNNNMDEYDEMLMTAGPIGAYDSKRLRYDDDEPTDLSQKGGSSDTSSVHNSNLTIPKIKKPLPNLIPLNKEGENILNLSTDLASRSSLSDIASMFFNEKQISEMLQPTDKSEAVGGTASQLSPNTTNTSSSASSKSLLNRKTGSFFDKIKSSSTTNENLICPCGHMAKCLSESIIHRKTCTFSPLSANDDIDLDDDEHDEDGEEGRLEIDFTEDDECDKQSHSALNLSVSGSTRCQHCRHRCKSSADLLNHLKICSDANSRCDSLSGDSCGGSRVMMGDTSANELQHPMENRVFIWNKLPRNQQESGVNSQSSEGNRQQHGSGNSSSNTGGSLLSANNDENSYYGVETAPGYGEVTKKMTPEEEAANSSLKKVYKCPHCSFWASTASRFHVHIVGHLNKKPFECSLCSYRSNWRWDITKHIRLKTIRDPSHKNARVLMNDETGRRNYTKYNKYITLMKVTEEDGDPKLMKSGEMTPNQVASLAFINDFNNKQQGSGSANNSSVNNILNGVREDITLEPIPSKQSVANVDDQLSDNFIRLPLLASMMNAALAQQQQQQQQNESEQTGGATLITPSVTISAVKKSPPTNQNYKPSDEITLEIRQEGNEKIMNYKCRKCNFKHINRDAVLAHVKAHFPDTNQGFSSPKTGQQPTAANANGPMQVSVNSNLYMNKVLAAMCLSQQQQQQQQHNSNTNTQLSNLMAAGLLDQANSNQLSGLALALAGKSPIKASHLNAAANIIEHGEQKASLNERHCRLKHAGVINIETLDRTNSGDRHAPPIYKPLVNGATNESNSNNNNNNNINSNNANSQFNLTLKALQQQQPNQNNNHNNVLINNNNNGNNQLKNANNAFKLESTNSLLHSSISAATALNAANVSQDLQAAAVAYLAAAAAAVANQNNNLKAINSMTEELILQQQLQQNDQIEITRVSSTNHLNNNNNNNNNNNSNNNNNNVTSQPPTNTSNLAQLLESNLNNQMNRVSSPQNNAKSKQQKCPLCTYICDSKSQMNYHISLHKPTQYECRLCTFVCAKKQHLSSHMRTVHQMQQNQIIAAASNSTNVNSNNMNVEFNLALQMTSATQNQQDSSNFSAPLAIDLSPSPVSRISSSLTHNHQNQLPPEYQYRMIYYCNKCPARYAQKHNDPLTAQKDLGEHLRQHESNSSRDDGKRKYHCDYCDYRAIHESIIQTHRYVHTTQYQEKCNELYKNCKEDAVYKAPKLMHITAAKKPHMHETIWVVDHDLNEGHQHNHNQTKHHQNSIITSSSQSNAFEVGNSLLKKQLESRQVATAVTPLQNEEIRNKLNQVEAEDSNTASTSASVATGDLAHDNETHAVTTPEAQTQDRTTITTTTNNDDNKEKCEHCPFESSNAEEFKTHLHQHVCISQQKLAYSCEHCDYSAEEQEQIEEHTRVHFNGIEKLKDVAFFTSYDKLELSMDQQEDEEAEENNLNIKKEMQNYHNNNNNNNNNEENRVNENLKDASAEALKATEPKQPKCAKIILYKNDGCLTIKKETQEIQSSQTQQQQTNTNTQNISDRLRRRISRQGAAGSTSTNNSLTSNQHCTPNNEEQALTSTSSSTPTTSHKTILVNAKTGQVISRN